MITGFSIEEINALNIDLKYLEKIQQDMKKSNKNNHITKLEYNKILKFLCSSEHWNFSVQNQYTNKQICQECNFTPNKNVTLFIKRKEIVKILKQDINNLCIKLSKRNNSKIPNRIVKFSRIL